VEALLAEVARVHALPLPAQAVSYQLPKHSSTPPGLQQRSCENQRLTKTIPFGKEKFRLIKSRRRKADRTNRKRGKRKEEQKKE
jgi:hypothetical protein